MIAVSSVPSAFWLPVLHLSLAKLSDTWSIGRQVGGLRAAGLIAGHEEDPEGPAEELLLALPPCAASFACLRCWPVAHARNSRGLALLVRREVEILHLALSGPAAAPAGVPRRRWPVSAHDQDSTSNLALCLLSVLSPGNTLDVQEVVDAAIGATICGCAPTSASVAAASPRWSTVAMPSARAGLEIAGQVVDEHAAAGSRPSARRPSRRSPGRACARRPRRRSPRRRTARREARRSYGATPHEFDSRPVGRPARRAARDAVEHRAVRAACREEAVDQPLAVDDAEQRGEARLELRLVSPPVSSSASSCARLAGPPEARRAPRRARSPSASAERARTRRTRRSSGRRRSRRSARQRDRACPLGELRHALVELVQERVVGRAGQARL